MSLKSIKRRLKRILQAIGDPDEKIRYMPIIMCVDGNNLREDIITIWKMRGKTYIDTLEKDSPEWQKAVEQYKREKEAKNG